MPHAKIYEAERQQRPASQAAATAFDGNKARELGTQQDAQYADDDRTQDVTNAADGGNTQGLSQRPVARFRHGDEHEVVIGPQDRVNEGNRRGGKEENVGVGEHGGESGLALCRPRQVLPVRRPDDVAVVVDLLAAQECGLHPPVELHAFEGRVSLR